MRKTMANHRWCEQTTFAQEMQFSVFQQDYVMSYIRYHMRDYILIQSQII